MVFDMLKNGVKRFGFSRGVGAGDPGLDEFLDGVFSPAAGTEGADPGLARLASLFHAAEFDAPDEQAGVQASGVERDVVASMARIIRMGGTATVEAPRPSALGALRRLAGRLTSRTGVISVGVVFATATAAAAATGHLPRPIQSTMAGVAGDIGISIPKPQAQPPTQACDLTVSDCASQVSGSPSFSTCAGSKCAPRHGELLTSQPTSCDTTDPSCQPASSTTCDTTDPSCQPASSTTCDTTDPSCQSTTPSNPQNNTQPTTCDTIDPNCQSTSQPTTPSNPQDAQSTCDTSDPACQPASQSNS